ncbi:MAG: HEAT repeat domain-containing protein [Candidatus Zixiibacteriota bacterium]
MFRYVIATGIACFIVFAVVSQIGAADETLKRKVDSLFVIASSGEVRFRDMVEPAMDSIAAIGEEAAPILIDKFTTKSARERWTIIRTLQRIGSPAVPYLVRALNRPNGLVVQRVCWALGDIGDTAAVMPLIGVIDHLRWQVREQAAGALGKIGDLRGSEAATSALNDPIGQVRKAAAVSCGKLNVNNAIEKLANRLSDEFYGARLAAAEALLKLDTGQVIDVLSGLFPALDRQAGNLACEVLGEIGTDQAIEILLAQTDSPDPERRAHAAVAIIKADPENNCGYHDRLLGQESDRLVRLKVESALASVRQRLFHKQ